MMKETNKKRVSTGLLVAVLTTALLSGGAFGAVMLDQSQELFDGSSPVFDGVALGQTFTPSVSEQLDHVDLLISDDSGDPGYPATVSIVETAGGAPIGTELAAVDVTGFVVGWNSIDFQAESVMLNAGSLYAIVLSNDDLQWWNPPTDAWSIYWGKAEKQQSLPLVDRYTGGVLWELVSGVWEQAAFDATYSPGFADAAFRTYMTPEPGTLMMLAFGGGDTDWQIRQAHAIVENYRRSTQFEH